METGKWTNSCCPSISQVQGVPACQPLPCFPEIPLIVLEAMDLHFQEHVYKDMNEKNCQELFVRLFLIYLQCIF